MTIITRTKDWKYDFGCDGVMTLNAACEALAVSRYMIDDYHQRGWIRKAKEPNGRIKVCCRSVREYLKSIEVGVESPVHAQERTA